MLGGTKTPYCRLQWKDNKGFSLAKEIPPLILNWISTKWNLSGIFQGCSILTQLCLHSPRRGAISNFSESKAWPAKPPAWGWGGRQGGKDPFLQKTCSGCWQPSASDIHKSAAHTWGKHRYINFFHPSHAPCSSSPTLHLLTRGDNHPADVRHISTLPKTHSNWECDLLQQDCANFTVILILYEVHMFKYYHSRDQSCSCLTYFIPFDAQYSPSTGRSHSHAPWFLPCCFFVYIWFLL